MAAAQGHATAQFNLGCSYEFGESVAPDAALAASWYAKAAAQGMPEAVAAAAVAAVARLKAARRTAKRA